MDLKEFDSPEQEYARDIWLLLYRCNGSNFADLLRMRWSNINRKDIRFYRQKTETTRKKNVKQIIVPRTKGIMNFSIKLEIRIVLLSWVYLRKGIQKKPWTTNQTK